MLHLSYARSIACVTLLLLQSSLPCLATPIGVAVRVPLPSSSSSSLLNRRENPATGRSTDETPIYHVFHTYTYKDQPILEETSDILDNMRMGLPFVAVQLGSHTPGDAQDQKSLIPLQLDNYPEWPTRALGLLERCVQAANETLFHAVKKECGSDAKSTASCKMSDFAVMAYWGTMKGMDFTRDGLLLTQCVAYRTVKAKCAYPLYSPCETHVIGDFKKQMWPASTNVTFIGSGKATTVQQMADDITAFNGVHGTSYSPPSTTE